MKELLVFWRNETFEWRHLVVIFENPKILNGIGQLSSRFTFAWSYLDNLVSFRRIYVYMYSLRWPIPMIKNIVQEWTWIVNNISTNHNPRLILKFFIESINVKRFFICYTTRNENNNILALKKYSAYTNLVLISTWYILKNL